MTATTPKHRHRSNRPPSSSPARSRSRSWGARRTVSRRRSSRSSQKHAPDFEAAALEMRASKAGNWLSVTATVNATSREQLDNLYRELVAHPMVKMVL